MTDDSPPNSNSADISSAAGSGTGHDGPGAPAVTAAEAEGALYTTAAMWAAEAVEGWIHGNLAKASLAGPLAVELLGKAVLWRRNPVLLVPLAKEAENSLVALATSPDLYSPKLRTVSLAVLLGRLERVLGSLCVEASRRTRILDARNGATHVGSATQSRRILADCLSLCGQFVNDLGRTEHDFYGANRDHVTALLDERRTEVGRTVTLKRARAQIHLRDLEAKVADPDAFKELTERFEGSAEALEEASGYYFGRTSIERRCPECGYRGRLVGDVDVDSEVDYDVEPLGGGQYRSYPVFGGWSVTIRPLSFGCPVCRLRLDGPEELAEADLPDSVGEIDAAELGEDFDPGEFYRYKFDQFDLDREFVASDRASAADVQAAAVAAVEVDADASHPASIDVRAGAGVAAGAAAAHGATVVSVDGANPTIIALIHAAISQGWQLSSTDGAGHAVLSSDAYAISIPVKNLNGRATNALMRQMRLAGFRWTPEHR